MYCVLDPEDPTDSKTEHTPAWSLPQVSSIYHDYLFIFLGQLMDFLNHLLTTLTGKTASTMNRHTSNMQQFI